MFFYLSNFFWLLSLLLLPFPFSFVFGINVNMFHQLINSILMENETFIVGVPHMLIHSLSFPIYTILFQRMLYKFDQVSFPLY